MWKILIYVSILCNVNVVMAVGTLLDGVGSCLSAANPAIPEDVKIEAKMNVAELARHWNYCGETHKCHTDDGYILKMYCVTNSSVSSNGEIVLFLHGLLGQSSGWCVNLAEQSPVFFLANCGYTVWVGNFRGNSESREHIKFTTNDPEYWDFSMDELAEYDFQAMVYYIKNASKLKIVHCIGHSMGATTILIAACSRYPIMKYICTFHLVAPVFTLQYSKSLMVLAINLCYDILMKFRKTELFKRSEVSIALNTYMCNKYSPLQNACDLASNEIMGYSENQRNESRRAIMQHCFPSGAGAGLFAHFGQLYKCGKLCHFNYGCAKNQAKYGKKEPPEYDAKQIEDESFFLYGTQRDLIANPRDFMRLENTLKSLKCLRGSHFITKEMANFSHADFLQSIHSIPLVFCEVLKNMQSHQCKKTGNT